jgi:hypothetical protein
MTVGQAKVTVFVPWYNEDLTVADVVAAFQQSLPGAAICVYDNNSQTTRGKPRSRSAPKCAQNHGKESAT